MIKIKIDRGIGLDKALKQFKRICNNAGVFKEIKRSTYYEKPSERRRREAQQRLKTIRNAQRGGKKKKPRILKPGMKPGPGGRPAGPRPSMM